MTNHITEISQRKAAMIAGLGLLIMTILAIFANFFVFQKLIVPGDSVTTANNILASQGLFRIGICSFLIVAILDVVVAWALYVLLEPVNKSLALLTALFRVVYATIFATALNNLFGVLYLLTNADYSRVFETGQLHAQVMLSLNAFNDGWNIGLAIFGLHLVALGYLVFKSGYMPRFLGILLIVAGLGYLVDSFGKILLSNYNITIAMFTFIGELLFMFWLLIKGAKIFEMKPESGNKKL
jgi:MFS family permease